MSNANYKKDLHDISLAVAQASKDYTDNSIEKLKWEFGTYDLSVETVNGTTMLLPTPTNTIQATMDKIYGDSKVSENLIVLNDVAETTLNGITYKVENGAFIPNGTASADFTISLTLSKPIQLTNGTSYTSKLISISGGFNYYAFWDANNTGKYVSVNTNPTTFNDSDKLITKIAIRIVSGNTYSGNTLPMLVKGTTAPTEFSVGFANIHNLELSGLVVKNSDDEVMQTLPIDLTSIEDSGGNKLFADGSIKGYGGVNDELTPYKATKRKLFITLNKTDYTWIPNSNSTLYYCDYNFGVKDEHITGTDDNDIVNNILCDKLQACAANDLFNGVVTSGICINNASASSFYRKIGISASDYANLTSIDVLVDLATPIEVSIDLSQLVKFEAYSNGSITLVNTNNQDTTSIFKYLKEVAK